jgi:hypothetical protein
MTKRMRRKTTKRLASTGSSVVVTTEGETKTYEVNEHEAANLSAFAEVEVVDYQIDSPHSGTGSKQNVR